MKIDIGGYLVLRNAKPIAQFFGAGDAYEYVEFLSNKYRGELFSMIYSDGSSHYRVDEIEKPTPLKTKKGK